MESNLPRQFEVLATYNAEVWRGIVHTEAWKESMQALQKEYDEWISRGCPEIATYTI